MEEYITKNIISTLKRASTNKEINAIFEKHSIKDLKERIDLLHKCNNPSLLRFQTPNYKNLTLEQKYAYEIEVFKYKTWEKSDLYEKHGL